MNPIKSLVQSQKGVYSIVFVTSISAVFMILSINLGQNIQNKVRFATENKEKQSRHTVVNQIIKSLYNETACKKTFKNSPETTVIKNLDGSPAFDLSVNTGFVETDLPKPKRLRILNCNPDSVKNKGEAIDLSKDCENFLSPKKPLLNQQIYHSKLTLEIKFQKYFPEDKNDFYYYYSPIAVETGYRPKLRGGLSNILNCSTVESALSKFFCKPMTFEISCCRYIHELTVAPDTVQSFQNKPVKKTSCLGTAKTDGCFAVSNNDFYTLHGLPPSGPPGNPPRYKFVSTPMDPMGLDIQKDCQGRANIGAVGATCTYQRGWVVFTKCADSYNPNKPW